MKYFVTSVRKLAITAKAVTEFILTKATADDLSCFMEQVYREEARQTTGANAAELRS